ncbi:hypothetical protein ViNHUV68_36520 [Vibrio sp. NH-UV-68]
MRKLQTYTEWKTAGFQVKRGEKSKGTRHGQPLFRRDQVVKSALKRRKERNYLAPKRKVATNIHLCWLWC